MRIIVVTDIFGQTPALLNLAESIKADSIIDPYSGEDKNFINEASAYEYFSTHVGLDNYVELLTTELAASTEQIILIGFSIGASAIWQLSAEHAMKDVTGVKQAICFYGSQIRKATDINPKFATSLIFPTLERHFDVQALAQVLSVKTNVNIEIVNYLHGFMNSHSDNFNISAYNNHLARLLTIVDCYCPKS